MTCQPEFAACCAGVLRYCLEKAASATAGERSARYAINALGAVGMRDLGEFFGAIPSYRLQDVFAEEAYPLKRLLAWGTKAMIDRLFEHCAPVIRRYDVDEEVRLAALSNADVAVVEWALDHYGITRDECAGSIARILTSSFDVFMLVAKRYGLTQKDAYRNLAAGYMSDYQRFARWVTENRPEDRAWLTDTFGCDY